MHPSDGRKPSPSIAASIARQPEPQTAAAAADDAAKPRIRGGEVGDAPPSNTASNDAVEKPQPTRNKSGHQASNCGRNREVRKPRMARYKHIDTSPR
ncbi:MAG: hypothetical protein ACOY3V_01740, partial [Pseudomonadota bacterium]